MNTYNLTQEQKNWLQDLINILPDGELKTGVQYWLNHMPDNVTEVQLNSLLNYWFTNTQYFEQVRLFTQWVEGGDRPPHPHG